MKPPPLKDDCFAMPPGVDWTPVDVALALLRSGLHTVAEVETISVANGNGRFLAADVVAERANPPYANSAVDGYGFAFDGLPASGVIELPVARGRAAAGDPMREAVPAGRCVRILTGALLPLGVDTVVLEEDCSFEAGRIAFRAGLKRGANTRAAGEDVVSGDAILRAGQRVRPVDLALMSACGVREIAVRKPLRIAVLSTGDEVVDASDPADDHQIYDANRPMLLALLENWGVVPIDLGHVADDADALRKKLDQGAKTADVVLTSGGASAGDEDHVSALLKAEGGMQTWRVAVKPGRPIAMALWQGVPVFGLPGNPVAALVCTLVFARPAIGVLAGAQWQVPDGFMVPAAFAKSKKAGRREYLRARMRDGAAEVFGSEGSGRISGLTWAEGLVELADEAQDIARGDLVRFIPLASFDL